MESQPNVPILATDVALAFPIGFWAETGRAASAAYFNADRNAKFDPEVGRADFKAERGNRRRAYLNHGLRKIAELWPERVEVLDVCMGPENGSNNHVELRVGKYVVTHHHLSGVRTLPDCSKYLEQNTGLNHELEQMELIPLREYMPEKGFIKPFNILLLHRENPQESAEVGEIEIVFALARKRLATFPLRDIVRIQAQIAQMEPEALFDFKFRHEETKRRNQA